jgi:hypothetical protein
MMRTHIHIILIRDYVTREINDGIISRLIISYFVKQKVESSHNINCVCILYIVITNFHVILLQNFSNLIPLGCIPRYILFYALYANVVNQYCAKGHQKCS